MNSNKAKSNAFSIVRLRSLAVTALFAALICVLSPFSLSVSGLIPVSLASFAVLLAAGMLEPKRAVSAVAVFIFLGAVGLPVFSGFQGGLQKLAGVTGGFITGFLPMAFIVSFIYGRIKRKWALPLAMIAGTAVLYFFGTVWFMLQTKNPLSSALASCVLPFLAGDAAKIVAACALTFALKERIGKTANL